MKRLLIIMFIILIMTFTVQGQKNISQFEAQVKGVLKQVSPSLVKVISQSQKTYIATGIAIDRDYVITNIMVIRNPYSRIFVSTVGGKKYPAKVVGKDRNSAIAVLKLDEKVLTPIKKAKKFEVGDWVALVGAFYKQFPSIYQGLLSSFSNEAVILNAPVAPGASGGAVVNKKGELIGVIRGRIGFSLGPDYTFKDHSAELLLTSPRSQNQNLCFAIPVNRINRVYMDLKKFGKTRRGWLGVGLFFNGEKVVVDQITNGSPADLSGLQLGDIFTSIGDKTIENPSDVSEVIKSLRPEEKVRIKVLRKGKALLLEAVIGEVSDPKNRTTFGRAIAVPSSSHKDSRQKPHTFTIPERTETLPRKKNYVLNISGSNALGIDVMNLSPELAREFQVKEGFGLMISKIYRDSAASKAGFKVADILVEINGSPLKDASVLRNLIVQSKENQKIKVKLYRDRKLKNINATPDRSKGFDLFFDQFKNKMEELNFNVAAKNTDAIGGPIKLLGHKLYINGKRYDLKEVDQHKKEIDKLKKESAFLKNKIKKLEETLEQQKESKQPF